MLVIEAYHEGRWEVCAQLAPLEPAAGRRGRVRLTYEASYARGRLGATDIRAVSCRHPVTLGSTELRHWPAFLIDMLPQGAAKRRILGAANTNAMSDWDLLLAGAWNPVGNLRVQRPRSERAHDHPGFDLHEVAALGDGFLDHALSVGASVAGSTDTQGETPKFWLLGDEHHRVHPDGGDLDHLARDFWLAKFPSHEAGKHSLTILQNEARYQRVARDMGLRVTQDLPFFLQSPHPEAREGALILPRFDRRLRGSAVERLGVESIYAVMGVVDAAASLRHDEVLIELSRHVTDFDLEIKEYVGRDILNMAMGNTDNHGRNTALLKDTDGRIALSPIFDFGPMFLDQRVMTRATSWSGQRGHVVDWDKVLLDLATRFEDQDLDFSPYHAPLVEYLHEFGIRLMNLPGMMRAHGIDDFIIERRQQAIVKLAADLQSLGSRFSARSTPRVG